MEKSFILVPISRAYVKLKMISGSFAQRPEVGESYAERDQNCPGNHRLWTEQFLATRYCYRLCMCRLDLQFQYPKWGTIPKCKMIFSNPKVSAILFLCHFILTCWSIGSIVTLIWWPIIYTSKWHEILSNDDIWH